MKPTLLALSFLLAATTLPAQKSDPAQDATQPSSSCGPLGCISPTVQAAPVQGGSPVVIRSTDAQAAVEGLRSVAPSPAASPAPAQNDFQQFVQDALGHGLPVFGASLFANGGGNFAPASGAVPPADYVLGSGDQVIIRTSGKIDMDVHATVDRNGQIFIPRVGTVTVAGLRLDRLEDFIRATISRQFTGFELSVSLGQLRSFQIFVLGDARAPGVYTISALNTLINALFSSGGPSSTGTLRDIQLKRDGKTLVHFDVYRLLLQGDKSEDTHLLPGDVIFIPPLGPQVAVDGDVGTPGIFEILPGETVGAVLSEAGGLSPIAATSRAVLEHVIDHSRRSVEELTLNSAGLAVPLQTADILRVYPLSPKISDAVTLRGNVAMPGRYAWRPGMRVSDLIPNREFLLTRSYYNRQNALDTPTGLHAFSNSPGTNTPSIAIHDTEINWNYAVIERLDPTDLTTHLVPFALGQAIADPASPENKQLIAGDVVVIYSRNDVALPLELQAKFVQLDGQVQAPGTYRVSPDETLRDLVQRAGGLAPHAYLYASQLTRGSVADRQAAELKKLIDRESQAILAPSNQRVMLANGAAGGTGDLELRRAYLAQLSKVQPDGRVVLRIPAGASTLADVPAIPLEDGDHYFVPQTPNTVDVLGSVFNPAALSYVHGLRAGQYLDQAGGPMREADTKREFILRANGTVVNRENVHDFKRIPLNPGDAVVVPAKLRQGVVQISIPDFAQLLTTLALTAVTLKATQ